MAADCGPGCSPTSRMPPRCARRTAWTCGWNAGTGRSRSSTAGSSSAASTCPTSFSSGCARRRSDTPRPPLRDACGREGAPLSCILLNKKLVCRILDGIAVLAGIVAGIALGGALGWLVGGARGRVQAERALREVEGRAQAAAATVDELRRSQASSQSRAEGLEAERRRLEGERAAMAARAGELERGLTEQRRLLDDAKGELGTTFQALAAAALQRSNEGFLQLATATLDTADGRLRPDGVVRLLGGKSIVVDAKAPMGAYLSAHDAKTEAEQQQHLQHHAAQVKAHVHKLGAKSYWNQFTASPELVVMFLPGDRFYAAALEQIPGLIEEAFANRVLVATPTTLIGILQAIHAGGRQERLAANAEEISRAGRELHERVATFAEHLAKVGSALGRTVDAFNHGVGSFETRVLPGARRLEELSAAGKKAVPDLEPIDARPRPLAAELDLGLLDA